MHSETWRSTPEHAHVEHGGDWIVSLMDTIIWHLPSQSRCAWYSEFLGVPCAPNKNNSETAETPKFKKRYTIYDCLDYSRLTLTQTQALFRMDTSWVRNAHFLQPHWTYCESIVENHWGPMWILSHRESDLFFLRTVRFYTNALSMVSDCFHCSPKCMMPDAS